MNVFYQDLLGSHEVSFSFSGETFYFLNDSKRSSFYSDSKCQRPCASWSEYVRITSFLSRCFAIDSVKPYEIVFKIRISKEQKTLQILDVFNKLGNKVTNNLCRDYLQKFQPFLYGEYFLCSNLSKISFNEDDFDLECLEDFVCRNDLRSRVISKIKNSIPKEGLIFSNIKLCYKGEWHIL